MNATDTHAPMACERDIRRTVFIGKGYKSVFRCPCGRESWQALNFMSRRVLMCDGKKFSKVARGHDTTVEVEG